MFKLPPNPDTSLPNRHLLAMGLTGSGKSQIIKNSDDVPPSGVRTVLFDPSRDHSKGTHYYNNRADFARALAAANASGRGFRVGYDGMRSPEIYDWWCECCIAILDGKKTTYMVSEELGAVSKNAAQALPAHKFLLTESRKYGGVYVGTTQFPARISKDVYDNVNTIYFGRQSMRLVNQFARDFGLPYDTLKSLPKLHFIRWSEGNVDFLKLQFTGDRANLIRFEPKGLTTEITTEIGVD